MPLKPRHMIDESDPRVAPFGHPAPPWMVNYADLMTELVCFYLILFSMSSALSKPLQDAQVEIESAMKEQEVAAEVEITKDGLVISLQEAGFLTFFESGSANLTDKMKGILDDIAPTFLKLATKRHDLIVEGYTDDVPIRSAQYASNWELSTGRATNVVQYLLKTYEYPPNRIGAIGYGEHRNIPRTPDEDLVAWRSKNRRVVFIIKNPTPKPSDESES